MNFGYRISKKIHISGFEIVHHTLKINVNAYVSDQNCNAFLKKWVISKTVSCFVTW